MGKKNRTVGKKTSFFFNMCFTNHMLYCFFLNISLLLLDTKHAHEVIERLTILKDRIFEKN